MPHLGASKDSWERSGPTLRTICDLGSNLKMPHAGSNQMRISCLTGWCQTEDRIVFCLPYSPHFLRRNRLNYLDDGLHPLECHHRDETVSYYPRMLGLVIAHPDRREVIPLMPEHAGICGRSSSTNERQIISSGLETLWQ